MAITDNAIWQEIEKQDQNSNIAFYCEPTYASNNSCEVRRAHEHTSLFVIYLHELAKINYITNLISYCVEICL
jgi:hypothetical protein